MNRGVQDLMKLGYSGEEAYEIRREYIRLCRLAFPEEDQAVKKAWIRRNPEKHRDYSRRNTARWREENKEHANAQARKSMALWRKRHPELWKERNAANGKQWRRRYPEKVRANTSKRRAIQLGLQPKRVSLRAIQKVYNRCQWWRTHGFDVAVDHIIPLGVGGFHSAKNLQIIYAKENSAKGCRTDYVPRVIFK